MFKVRGISHPGPPPESALAERKEVGTSTAAENRLNLAYLGII